MCAAADDRAGQAGRDSVISLYPNFTISLSIGCAFVAMERCPGDSVPDKDRPARSLSVRNASPVSERQRRNICSMPSLLTGRQGRMRHNHLSTISL